MIFTFLSTDIRTLINECISGLKKQKKRINYNNLVITEISFQSRIREIVA